MRTEKIKSFRISNSGERPLQVALISCGLGNVRRGFEASAARWFEGVKQHPGLDVRLFSGGSYPGAQSVWNIPRGWVLTSPLKVFKRINPRRFWEFCYGVEQVSFALFFGWFLLRCRPDVVWTKEVPFAYFLLWYRFVYGLRFKIVFANGGGFRPATYKCFDFIQHLTNRSYEDAISYGIPAARMTVLTNCVSLNEPLRSRADVRRQLRFADDDWIVICVAAWNMYHKRIDYLIKEVAAINDEKVKLVLCGHPDADDEYLHSLAAGLLGDRIRWLTLPEEQVHETLRAADVFVLASLHEALGNSMVEALLAGIPLISHNHSAARFIHDDPLWVCDLSQPGALTARLKEFRASPDLRDRVAATAARVTEQFSQAALVPKFYAMLRNVVSPDCNMQELKYDMEEV